MPFRICILRFYDHSDSRVNGNLDETAKKVCGALRRPPYIPALKDGGLRRTWLNTWVKPQFLYVIAPLSHDNGPCKLGISTDPDRRVKQLQTAHPERLGVRYREPVDPEKVRLFEKLLHRDIGYLRCHGEWFELTVAEATAHVQFTIIEYDGVLDLASKVRRRIV